MLLLWLEENDMTTAALSNWRELAYSSARIADTAEGLPEQIRQQISELLGEVDEKQAEIQTTLAQAQETVASIDRALERSSATAESFELTARSVNEAGRTWVVTANTIGQVVQDMAALREDATTQPAEPVQGERRPTSPTTTQAARGTADSDRPFDILDYRDTADSLASAATELHKVAVEIRTTIDSPHVPERIEDIDTRVQGTVDRTAAEARELTNHVFWRVGQLIVLAFGLAVMYRLLVVRLISPK